MLAFPMKYATVESLLPILENDIRSILKGAQSMTFTIIGFEILNVIYPFVKTRKNQKTCSFRTISYNHHLFSCDAGVHCLLQ